MMNTCRSDPWDPFELREILDSFRIVIDTREQKTPRAAKRIASFGVPSERCTMSYGDYCGNITFPDGQDLLDTSKRITPACVIERKMDLDELAGCFGRGRDRFEREFERATEAGAKVYLLIEDGSWEAILMHRYKSRLHPAALMASLTAWMVRYDITVLFCKSSTSGTLIKEVLYRDMKERLKRGEYG